MSTLEKRFQMVVDRTGINQLRIWRDQLYLLFLVEGSYEKHIKILDRRINELS